MRGNFAGLKSMKIYAIQDTILAILTLCNNNCESLSWQCCTLPDLFQLKFGWWDQADINLQLHYIHSTIHYINMLHDMLWDLGLWSQQVYYRLLLKQRETWLLAQWGVFPLAYCNTNTDIWWVVKLMTHRETEN